MLYTILFVLLLSLINAEQLIGGQDLEDAIGEAEGGIGAIIGTENPIDELISGFSGSINYVLAFILVLFLLWK
ncbi:unnamed protein product [Caenorhabditis nigoni]|uniref:Uncharacterized protein n=1 Tax=Caenorhabditis nigoni TaxID=1611254 RepID=A0A2G5TB14_9PELO|nr:hypothetical protein B9Z55_017859 [Caenorhabditis nigoni]